MFGQVILISSLVILAVAVAAVFAASRLAEVEAVGDAALTADIVAEGLVQPAVTAGLVDGDPASIATMDEVVTNHILGASIVRVKIWDASGRVLYSDEPRLIGQSFELEEEEREVLTDPRTDAEVSDVQAPENRYERDEGKLLEVYRPIWETSGEPLLFEAYFRYDTVTERSWLLWVGFAGVTIGSIVLVVALLIPLLVRMLGVLRRAREHREQLLQHALDASADERRRIAGTLHDGVVQDLAATSYAISGSVERARGLGDATLASDLSDAAATVRGSIGGLRSLLVDIYPPSLEAAGLAAALDDLAASARARGLDVRVSVAPGVVTDAETDRLVYRVVQECLGNAVRHASAAILTVSLEPRADGLELRIEDDGVGFDAPRALANPAEGHFGLRVLADVVAAARGELALRTAPGAGTTWRMRTVSA